MRTYHVITIVAVLVIGLGAKQLFFPPIKSKADIDAILSHSMNVLQMQIDYQNKQMLARQRMNNPAFVVSAFD